MDENRNKRVMLFLGIVAVIIIISVASLMIIIASKDKNNIVNTENNVVLNNEVINNENIEEKYDEGIAKTELPKVEINQFAEVNSTIDGRIPSFYNPVIPQGFKAITNAEDVTIDENAIWGNQNSYLYGLVIEDKSQNQFVWVPVENMDIFKTTEWQKNKPKETIDPTYVEPTDNDKDSYYKMYYKVKKYGGFYVGRYETGDASSDATRTEINISENMGIRKYLVAYNFVPFKLSTINKREITGAKELAEKFQKTNGYKTVKASVMYGVQWDSMLRFIKSNDNNVNDSIKWGNFPVSVLNFKDIAGNEYQKQDTDVYLLRTGSSEQTKTKNIYDVAGNLAEWTMETTKTDVNIARGGSYVSTLGQLAASRYAYQSNTANNAIGFRISLYIE